jgi:YbgC/YbaW family acyl-CoA thioester hydrolase
VKQQLTEREIMWGDLDSLGIVFYPRYYEWMSASGHVFFDSIDLNLGTLLRERKIIFSLVETSARYFNPGRYQQKICIATEIEALGDKTVLLLHQIRLATDSTLLVEGREKRICLSVTDSEHLRAITIPDDIRACLQKACR